MEARCANPSCQRAFTNLKDGKLYLLPALNRRKKLSDYCYWLCPSCAGTVTIERVDNRIGFYPLSRQPRTIDQPLMRTGSTG